MSTLSDISGSLDTVLGKVDALRITKKELDAYFNELSKLELLLQKISYLQSKLDLSQNANNSLDTRLNASYSKIWRSLLSGDRDGFSRAMFDEGRRAKLKEGFEGLSKDDKILANSIKIPTSLGLKIEDNEELFSQLINYERSNRQQGNVTQEDRLKRAFQLLLTKFGGLFSEKREEESIASATQSLKEIATTIKKDSEKDNIAIVTGRKLANKAGKLLKQGAESTGILPFLRDLKNWAESIAKVGLVAGAAYTLLKELAPYISGTWEYFKDWSAEEKRIKDYGDQGHKNLTDDIKDSKFGKGRISLLNDDETKELNDSVESVVDRMSSFSNLNSNLYGGGFSMSSDDKSVGGYLTYLGGEMQKKATGGKSNAYNISRAVTSGQEIVPLYKTSFRSYLERVGLVNWSKESMASWQPTVNYIEGATDEQKAGARYNMERNRERTELLKTAYTLGLEVKADDSNEEIQRKINNAPAQAVIMALADPNVVINTDAVQKFKQNVPGAFRDAAMISEAQVISAVSGIEGARDVITPYKDIIRGINNGDRQAKRAFRNLPIDEQKLILQTMSDTEKNYTGGNLGRQESKLFWERVIQTLDRIENKPQSTVVGTTINTNVFLENNKEGSF